MTTLERIAFHKKEMLKNNSEQPIIAIVGSEKGQYDKDYTPVFEIYEISPYAVHEHCIFLLENGDLKKYNLQIMKCLKEYPKDLLINLTPLSWDSVMPLGKDKGKLISEISTNQLIWYKDNNVLIFDSAVLYYITSLKLSDKSLITPSEKIN